MPHREFDKSYGLFHRHVCLHMVCTVSALSSDACAGPPLAPCVVDKQLSKDVHVKVTDAVRGCVSGRRSWRQESGFKWGGRQFSSWIFFPFSLPLAPQST